MSSVSGIVRMNLAAMDRGDLVLLRGALQMRQIGELDDVKRAETQELIESVQDELESRLR